ncbi:MAG TPA: hypothetical protein VFE36_11025 [Candidatus Baltobacteraceae bacterium]|jgi:hypothetical protein|nr:hypothetical protein [Candidatus Baltobacteraceae bacterium]
MRFTFLATIVAFLAASVPMGTQAQMTGTNADAAYIAKVTQAAPPAIVKGATIVEMRKDGTMRTVQSGNNGFTCMFVPPGDPMCADTNAMQWLHAYVTHTAPPASVGFVYMLAGDTGASNTDPYATGQTANNHWIKTGSHVMIVGPSAKTMAYPTTADADPTKPYVMWADTPYAHAMIPISGP